MKTATARAPIARKSTSKKVDLSKLSNKQVNALPLDVFIASLSPWARRFYYASKPFEGKLRAVK